jgi:hypothetical protein
MDEAGTVLDPQQREQIFTMHLLYRSSLEEAIALQSSQRIAEEQAQKLHDALLRFGTLVGPAPALQKLGAAGSQDHCTAGPTPLCRGRKHPAPAGMPARDLAHCRRR